MSVLEFTYLRPTLGRGNGRYGAYPNTVNDLQWQFVKMSASQASPERSPARGSSYASNPSAAQLLNEDISSRFDRSVATDATAEASSSDLRSSCSSEY
jgi:hypothetical protein